MILLDASVFSLKHLRSSEDRLSASTWVANQTTGVPYGGQAYMQQQMQPGDVGASYATSHRPDYRQPQ